MKVDTSLIEGFEAMTMEQKLEALLKLDMDPTKLGFKTQADFDKVMTENAEKKKRIKELETQGRGNDDEKTALTKRLEELEESNKTLLRNAQIASTTSQFIGMGYDEALAKEAAEASADGDMAKLFAAQQKFIKAHDEKLKAEALKGMRPPVGGGKGGSDETDEGVKMAQTLAKARSESLKTSNDILDQYLVK